MLNKYLKEIVKVEKRGDAREETYYACFKILLEDLAHSFKKKKVEVTTLPLKTEGGNPDFRVWDGKHDIIGYIEAKKPGTDLSKIEDTEQIQRYIKTFPNVILTNFYEFYLYRNGELVDKVEIAYHSITKKVRTTQPIRCEEEFLDLFKSFYLFSQPQIYNARDLAVTLADKTRHLERIVLEILESDKDNKSDIGGFYIAFRDYLISELDKKQFSDLYAQTITYGLFAARSRTEKDFSRKIAFDNIPKTIGILRDIFQNISLKSPHPDIEWIVDDISAVLNASDIKEIMDSFYKEGKGKDPIIHFYETFLGSYDPKLREKRGVYYTPEPVVSYIVRSINQILKKEFGKSTGLGDLSVTVLDPAAGTLTFIAHAFQVAMKEILESHGDGVKEEFIKKHLLKNFYAFELMMAPYAIGHLKMGFVLEEMGYKLQQDERMNLYLTNTLEMEDLQSISIPGIGRSLSEESKKAGEIKKDQPVLVVMGNPPYSGISVNKGKWIVGKIEDYKYVDGEHFKERKHWLHDDYVKFIRFAQWKIDELGEGVVGLITNHSFLDNPTFRGMRQSLMNSFNEIHILNLHGNTKRKEVCPDGSKDDNVFDITRGVAITLFIKKKNIKKKCKIYYKDLWGKREKKYKWLNSKDYTVKTKEILKPTSPFYFFIPYNESGLDKYQTFEKIDNIFPIHVSGIVTARDNLVLDYKKSNLLKKIEIFRDLTIKDELIEKAYSVSENYQWKIKAERKKFNSIKDWKDHFKKILYRPFDVRHIYYQQNLVFRMRKDVMQHMLKENTGLICPKQFKEQSGALVTNEMIGHKTVSAYDSNYLFPLYIYPDKNKNDLFASSEKAKGKRPNIDEQLIKKLTNTYKKKPTPEQILNYIYAVLYSNEYRTKYAEFLKSDFPKIPFTKDFKLFKETAKLGQELVDLHLLKSKKLDKPISRYHGKESNVLGKTKKECRNYQPESKAVYINNEQQYFDGITQEVWEYQIGGYQVLDKWLDSHKGRKLELEDILHFQKVITSLSFTIELQKDIDKLYPQIENTLIE